jgi:hypothetical protein
VEWSAEHELTAHATPADVWRLWSDHTRWREWNPEVVSVRMHGPFARGTLYTLRFRGSFPMKFEVTACEHEREFTDEGALPGARMGHQRTIVPDGDGVRIHNRVYLSGRLARVYAMLLGRRMARGVRGFVEREKELAERETGA